MATKVNDDGAAEDQNLIHFGRNVDAVSIFPGDPSFRDFRHGPTVELELIFVIEKVTTRLQVVRPGNIHGEFAVKQCKDFLPDRSDKLAVGGHLVRAGPTRAIVDE
jgi:hypothetical protein